jgi:hypothetical protein
MLSEIFEPHTSKSENNSVVINHSGVVIFDQIKQLKEEGLTMPAIKKRLKIGGTTWNNLEQPTMEKAEQPGTTGMQKVEQPGTTELYQKLIEAHELRHKAEITAMENRFEYLMNALPPPDRMKDIIFLVAQLEQLTIPRLFKGKQTREAWTRLKDILGMIKTDER